MESRNGLITFGIFVVLFAFSFVFGNAGLADQNTLYGVLALIGYVVCIAGAFFNGFTSKKNGEALAVWFLTYAVLVSIIFVWYCTRCGSSFQWW
jgi:hypothetical protein